ncbi:AraC family transcriptional regulator [Anaerotruncus colihominis]|uniref:AraC family transcriptional regulator n=2 Tax=Anaerotruncus colihominis TaxID=169435 RepID=A0A845RJ87_9FIRM|nr:AraC family transcriptional regulator [Anaerotruncus colihominis]
MSGGEKMQEQIEAVQRMQDYIEKHLCEKISFANIASASLFSPWYARRLFIEYTGLTPADYIRKLRLQKSVLRLRDNKTKILDVALDLGFGSVDGYQRAFKREFGRNPKEYANNPVPLQLFTPYGVKFRYSERKKTMTSTRNVFIQVMDKPVRKAIIKRGIKATEYWAYCEEVGCDVWGLLTSMKSLSGEPVCLWLPKEYIKPGTSEYVQGVEVDMNYAGNIPDGFDVIELPAAKYLMFQGEPFKEEDYEQAINDIWEAEKKYEPSVIGYKWDNSNPKIQLEPIGTRGYIELLPIK